MIKDPRIISILQGADPTQRFAQNVLAGSEMYNQLKLQPQIRRDIMEQFILGEPDPQRVAGLLALGGQPQMAQGLLTQQSAEEKTTGELRQIANNARANLATAQQAYNASVSHYNNSPTEANRVNVDRMRQFLEVMRTKNAEAQNALYQAVGLGGYTDEATQGVLGRDERTDVSGLVGTPSGDVVGSPSVSADDLASRVSEFENKQSLITSPEYIELNRTNPQGAKRVADAFDEADKAKKEQEEKARKEQEQAQARFQSQVAKLKKDTRYEELKKEVLSAGEIYSILNDPKLSDSAKVNALGEKVPQGQAGTMFSFLTSALRKGSNEAEKLAGVRRALDEKINQVLSIKDNPFYTNAPQGVRDAFNLDYNTLLQTINIPQQSSNKLRSIMGRQ